MEKIALGIDAVRGGVAAGAHERWKSGGGMMKRSGQPANPALPPKSSGEAGRGAVKVNKGFKLQLRL